MLAGARGSRPSGPLLFQGEHCPRRPEKWRSPRRMGILSVCEEEDVIEPDLRFIGQRPGGIRTELRELRALKTDVALVAERMERLENAASCHCEPAERVKQFSVDNDLRDMDCFPPDCDPGVAMTGCSRSPRRSRRC